MADEPAPSLVIGIFQNASGCAEDQYKSQNIQEKNSQKTSKTLKVQTFRTYSMSVTTDFNFLFNSDDKHKKKQAKKVTALT